MASVKYSQAGRFLAAYGLTPEQLTKAQQKQVVHYLRAKKWWPWLTLVFLSAVIVFGYGVWVKYNAMQEFMGRAVVLSNSGSEVDLQKISGFSLEQGFNIGVLAVTAVYMILYSIFIPINIRRQKQALNAFLPLAVSKSNNEQHG